MFFEVKLDHYVPEMDQAERPSRLLVGRIEPELFNIWTLSLSKLLESTRYIKYEFYKQFFFFLVPSVLPILFIGQRMKYCRKIKRMNSVHSETLILTPSVRWVCKLWLSSERFICSGTLFCSLVGGLFVKLMLKSGVRHHPWLWQYTKYKFRTAAVPNEFGYNG